MNKALFIVLSFNVALIIAQTRAMPNDPRPQSGKVSLEIDFTTTPTTIEDLIRESNLIVDGRVTATLPSIRLNPKNLEMIQTDSLVAVSQVLSGSLPTGVTTIAVSQFGGRIGNLEAVFPDDELMNAGERYIFFLRRDNGASPNTAGYTRYYPAGGWIGKARVANGTISFPQKAHGSGLTAWNASDIAAFLAAVTQKISISAPHKVSRN